MSRLPAEVLADLAFWGRTMERAAARGELLDAKAMAEAASVMLEAHAIGAMPKRPPEPAEKVTARTRRFKDRQRTATVVVAENDTGTTGNGEGTTVPDETTTEERPGNDRSAPFPSVPVADASRARVSSSSNSTSALPHSPSARAMPTSGIGDETAGSATGDDATADPPVAKPRADRAAPWMADVRRIWRSHYGGEPPAQAVKALRPVVTRLGADGMLERLTAYCDRTEARFVDPWRFAATAGSWGPADAPSDGPPASDAAITDAAHRLWAGFKATGILRAQTTAQYEAAVVSLVSSGAVASLVALRTIWPTLDRQRLLDAQTDAYAERHVADVLRVVWRDLTPAAALSPAA